MLNRMHIKKYGRLNNYVAMYRRRCALTLSELAMLIGKDSPASVDRYEANESAPNLETALALAITLEQPVEELFPGIVEELREKVASRAQALLEAMDDKPSHENSIKLPLLARLAHPNDDHIIPCEDAA